ncbi:hypothetical protein O1R50_12950 [Glycomyces luteolus]|uniref:Uncharacterized protein n=1 Tax=Glycomyces luteolus TaxID=2670330 RepID=A0A9X3STR8_9ACTN|nr:hypothetical protein [Glycomyces luteolus]MDA1360538.1 hypothetical protein [Glycomyces luteolus]
MRPMQDTPRRTPWTAIVAGIVPPLYCFVIAGLLISMGDVQDFGDMAEVGRPLLVIGLVELLLSVGVWLGSRILWWVTVVGHGLVIPSLILAQAVNLGAVWAYAACMVVPAVLTMPFLLLPQSRRWCQVGTR